jgi:hypothetical protein
MAEESYRIPSGSGSIHTGSGWRIHVGEMKEKKEEEKKKKKKKEKKEKKRAKEERD